jgi:hypothetical protein
VRYEGTADGYLLILTNKRPSIVSKADAMPVAALYVQKDHTVAVSEADFLILKEQGHISNDGLKEVSEKKPDRSKPIFTQPVN